MKNLIGKKIIDYTNKRTGVILEIYYCHALIEWHNYIQVWEPIKGGSCVLDLEIVGDVEVVETKNPAEAR